MTRFKLVVAVMMMLLSSISYAEKLVVPPANIVKFAKKFAYNDFPQAIDIISIIRVESNFNPKAFNPETNKKDKKRRVPPSIGLMQVQAGSFDVYTNMKQGSERLREYFVKQCKRSIECAVKSYNIGPTNFKRGKYPVSAKEYWDKFNLRKSQYLTYNKTADIF